MKKNFKDKFIEILAKVIVLAAVVLVAYAVIACYILLTNKLFGL